MTSKTPLTESDLHAYLDGELDSERCREVQAWLADHPQDVQRLRDYEKQTQSLRDMFDPVLSEALPLSLQAGTVQALRHGRRRSLLRVAAAMAYLMVGAVIGYGTNQWLINSPQARTIAALPQQALLAHAVYTPEVVHPVEVTAEQEEHLTKWLSKRLGTPLRVPHLSILGFELVGGRLLPDNSGAAAQFMYENAQGKRLTLYVKVMPKGSRETAFRYQQRDGVSVFYWVDGILAYALSGQVEKQSLLQVANEVYRVLN